MILRCGLYVDPERISREYSPHSEGNTILIYFENGEEELVTYKNKKDLEKDLSTLMDYVCTGWI